MGRVLVDSGARFYVNNAMSTDENKRVDIMYARTVISDAPPPAYHDRVLSKEEVSRIIGRHFETLRIWENKGNFPRRLVLGPRTVGWLESEITAWLKARADERQAA